MTKQAADGKAREVTHPGQTGLMRRCVPDKVGPVLVFEHDRMFPAEGSSVTDSRAPGH